MANASKLPTTTKGLKAAYEKYGSLKAIARALAPVGPRGEGNFNLVRNLYLKAVADGTMERLKLGGNSIAHSMAVSGGTLKVKKVRPDGRRRALKAKPVERHPDKVTRFLFSCAQNNTKLFDGWWKTLLTLKNYYHAELHISRFAYIRAGLGARGDKTNFFASVDSHGNRKGGVDPIWFDERIVPYISDNRLEIAPGLVWCGEANILPTAAKPLSGLESYTGRASSIFPHVKIAMDSIATSEVDPTKFLYTTGTVTQRNYIQRKEGLKAEFHHCYGALLVEVEPDGTWYCRQINADSEGVVYDIDIRVKGDEVVTNKPAVARRRRIPLVEGTFVEGAKWGDIHREQMDPLVEIAIWGKGGILDYLQPKHQFMDDIFDMFARNHHEMDDPHTMLSRYITGQDSVSREALRVGEFVHEAHRPWCRTVIVNSNHDRAIMRWLKDKRGQFDPVNRTFWHTLNKRVDDYMFAHRGDQPIILREAILEVLGLAKEPKGWTFLRQGDTFIICRERGGGIDNGQHGDDGPNGARGTTEGLSKTGRKINKGHDHCAAIIDSAYSTGCCLDLKNPPSYQRGPSSGSNSHIITYANGKRQIITQYGPERKAWADR